jgi:hypothetical protein
MGVRTNRLRSSPLTQRRVPLVQRPDDSVQMDREPFTETVSKVPDRLLPAVYMGQDSPSPNLYLELLAPNVTATQASTVAVARISGWLTHFACAEFTNETPIIAT